MLEVWDIKGNKQGRMVALGKPWTCGGNEHTGFLRDVFQALGSPSVNTRPSDVGTTEEP